jgi:hypothetical protein
VLVAVVVNVDVVVDYDVVVNVEVVVVDDASAVNIVLVVAFVVCSCYQSLPNRLPHGVDQHAGQVWLFNYVHLLSFHDDIRHRFSSWSFFVIT